MKRLTRSLLLLLSLTTGWLGIVKAQTLEQSLSAYGLKDYRTAFDGFKKLAEQGDVNAQFALGAMYGSGQGVPEDEQQALAWYRKAAEQGNSDAQHYLGLMYKLGMGGLPKDAQQAAAWYRKAAEQGDVAAQKEIGLMYEFGLGVPKDKKQAVAWYLKAAEQGDADTQYNLGAMYAAGDGLPKDEEQALTWFRRAAGKGNASAQNRLGAIYRDGLGSPKDAIQALAWFSRAAEQGDASAQYNLGVMYLIGEGAPKDGQQALAWFSKAAEQGDASAQYNLGVMFSNGQGVPKDQQQALAWYLKAAEQGLAVAQFELAKIYAAGRGVPKNEQQAVVWLQKAAEQGNVDAQYARGVMHAKGEGGPKDEQKAYFWWLLASAQGNQKAAELRDLVERGLSSDQRVAAQTAARNWEPKTAAQSIMEPGAGAAAPGGTNSAPNPTVPATTQADSTGSGFRVARGAIVTNYHVIDGCSRLSVNGTIAAVIGSDARSDLALLGGTLPGPSANLRAKRAAVGEPVAVAGFPLRGLLSGFNMTTGNLSSLSGIGGDTRLVQITAPVQPGNSGGPILDSAGNLMGVVVSKLDAIKAAKLTGDIPQNVNFAINVNVLRSFLDANGVEYDSASSDKPLATTAIAEKARGFTALVECWK